MKISRIYLLLSLIFLISLPIIQTAHSMDCKQAIELTEDQSSVEEIKIMDQYAEEFKNLNDANERIQYIQRLADAILFNTFVHAKKFQTITQTLKELQKEIDEGKIARPIPKGVQFMLAIAPGLVMTETIRIENFIQKIENPEFKKDFFKDAWVTLLNNLRSEEDIQKCIAAIIKDKKTLMRNDKAYLKMLEIISEFLKQR